MPYGFPSGADLRRLICEGGHSESSKLARELSEWAHVDSSVVINFARQFEQSRIVSIDEFLSRRIEHTEIGKYAIATLLCPLEDPAKFDDPTNNDDWYSALWNALVSEVHRLEDLKNNKLKVITFNYDRSLESYLHSAIKNTFAVSDAAALDAMASIPILHVYGSLGNFGIKTEGQNRPYPGKQNAISLTTAANGIKVIPEARDDDEVFKTTQIWFRESNRVCFLGFGFDQLNIKRLGLREVVEDGIKYKASFPSQVIASGYGKTEAELAIAKNLITGRLTTFDNIPSERPSWDHLKDKNLSTIRSFAWILN